MLVAQKANSYGLVRQEARHAILPGEAVETIAPWKPLEEIETPVETIAPRLTIAVSASLTDFGILCRRATAA